eukprot:jgi/Bigna1/69427/fgenesh1_pg.9_\
MEKIFVETRKMNVQHQVVLKVGDLVVARYRDHRRWYPGTIRRINMENDTLAIEYKDGDVWTSCPKDWVVIANDNLRLRKSVRNGKSSSSSEIMADNHLDFKNQTNDEKKTMQYQKIHMKDDDVGPTNHIAEIYHRKEHPQAIEEDSWISRMEKRISYENLLSVAKTTDGLCYDKALGSWKRVCVRRIFRKHDKRWDGSFVLVKYEGWGDSFDEVLNLQTEKWRLRAIKWHELGIKD